MIYDRTVDDSSSVKYAAGKPSSPAERARRIISYAMSGMRRMLLLVVARKTRACPKLFDMGVFI